MNDLQVRLDYSRDMLLITLAQGLSTLLVREGAKNTGKMVEMAGEAFSQDLFKLYPDGQETQS